MLLHTTPKEDLKTKCTIRGCLLMTLSYTARTHSVCKRRENTVRHLARSANEISLESSCTPSANDVTKISWNMLQVCDDTQIATNASVTSTKYGAQKGRESNVRKRCEANRGAHTSNLQ